jgi:hypothetical protein
LKLLNRWTAVASGVLAILALVGINGAGRALASATQGLIPAGIPVPLAPQPKPLRAGPGYWVAAADGGVFAYGRAHFSGSAAGSRLRQPVAAIAVSPTGKGYWLVAKDGGVFAYGDAPFRGSYLHAARPAVAIAPTPSGDGYWIAGSDGGVFAFGDAQYFGGPAGHRLNQPIVSMAATPSGKGYWLVAKDGGVFAYGDAKYLGGAAELKLNRGVVAIVGTRTGDGYWLAGADGGVFAYGDAGFFGSAQGANPVAPITGMASTWDGRGYWLVARDGGVFAYGDAGFFGAPAEDAAGIRAVGIGAGPGTDVRTQNRALEGTFGWDVSWPQCNANLPAGGYAFAVVGVTGGHAYSENPCLAQEFRWALHHGSVASLYVNVNWPADADMPKLADWMKDKCAPADLNCQAYWWGYRDSVAALHTAAAHHASAPMWWLDVETNNKWTPNQPLNVVVVKGAIAGLRDAGMKVGLYSSAYQWGVITGGFAPGLPTWVAGPNNAAQAAAACAPSASFGGGTPWLVQFPNGLDGNIVCEAGAKELLRAFRLPAEPAVPEFPNQ